jgi:c-di-GMP-binding flagellar brake protein YcgR
MEYREPTPSILLLHDGELAELASVIGSLGGVERCGDPTESDRNRAWDVVIASASRMLELHTHLPDTSAIRIAVLDGDSKTLRKMLYRADTDLLVRQPVHHAALRLLILHALYRGPEKRRTSRVSIGAGIRFRIGLRNRTAVLAELSARGCRLMVENACHRAAPDKLVKIVLPPQITNDERSFSLRGHVLRVSNAEDGTDMIAVLFETLRDSARKRLESIVLAHSQGPAVLNDAVAQALRSVPVFPQFDEAQSPDVDGTIEESESKPLSRDPHAQPSQAPGASSGEAASEQHAQDPHATQPSGSDDRQPHETRAPDLDDRDEIASPPPELDDPSSEAGSEKRRQERHTLSRRIVALSDEAARVLIGRDLSVGGMRIDATPGLALGDQLKVAIHVRADGQPLVVSAEIARDDGPVGMALRFIDLSPAAREYLEEMVFALPDIIDSSGSKEGSSVVVSEVVGRRAS